jgi:hypothetical protein
MRGGSCRDHRRYQCPMCTPPFGLAMKGSPPQTQCVDGKKRRVSGQIESGKKKKKQREDPPQSPPPKVKAESTGTAGPPAESSSEVCRACVFGSHSAHKCGIRGYSGNEALTVTGNPPSRAPSTVVLPPTVKPPRVPSVVKKSPASRPPDRPTKLARVQSPSKSGEAGAAAEPTKGKPGRTKKREACTFCKKTFASGSQLKFHLQVRIIMFL